MRARMKLVWGRSRRQRLAACLGLVVLLVACFDPPIRERLDLVFLPQGPVAVLYRVEISDHGSDNQNLARRVAELERSLLEGTDTWSRSFARLEPKAERLEWRKRGGELGRFERGAILEDPAALLELFAESPITVGYSAREDG